MHTDKGYIQEKDYLNKPEPFYHVGVPVLIGDIWKLGWKENATLKAEYEAKQALESQKAILLLEWEKIDRGLKAQFKPIKEEVEACLNSGDIAGALETMQTAELTTTKLKDIRTKFISLLQGV